jgi:hypothetical protein
MIQFDKETLEQRRQVLSEQLNAGIAEVTFTKVNGEVRTMPCTLQASLLPKVEVIEGKQKKAPKPEVMSVFCTDKKEWRSFRVDNVISVKAL